MKKVALLFTSMLLASQGYAANYQLSFLDALPGGSSTYASSINDSGQIVGSSFGVAVLWNGAPSTGYTASNLSALQTDIESSVALSINNNGQAAGMSRVSAGEYATSWNGSNATANGSIPSVANAINNNGQLAGYTWGQYLEQSQAVVWNGNTATALNPLAGNAYARANGINDAGQVVGHSQTWNLGSTTATVWTNNVATSLSTPAGKSSEAAAINNAGQIVGSSVKADGDINTATLWDGGTITYLTSGEVYSRANSINNLGQIVGDIAGQSGTFSALWENNTFIDLNSFLTSDQVNAGWKLTGANDINDNGWIVGSAINSQTNISRAFVAAPISPVPEPETYALMMGGLGLVGAAVRRRKAG